MQNTNFDASSLLEITDDASFIIQCYHVFLGRSLDPFELRHSLEMLSKGLSKKGFIYWIMRSPEFGNRWSIENIGSYQLECYFYKGIERLLKFFHLNRTPYYSNNHFSTFCHCGRFGWLAEEQTVHDYTFDTEYSALAEGQISQISSYLPALPGLTAVGHLASKLINGESLPIMPEQMIKSLADPKQNCFITNPDIIFQLLTTDDIASLAKATEDTLMLTMPRLPIPENHIGIIWGSNWDRTEFDSDGVFSRWMYGPMLNGSIHLLNQSINYHQVTLEFVLTVLDPHCQLSVSYHGESIPIACSSIRCKISLDLSLNPGCNTIFFRYAGKRLKQPDASGRLALFSIDNLVLTCHDMDCETLSGDHAYSMDEQTHGAGYYPYLLPDSLIRSQLHRNGFFEISAVQFSKTYTLTSLFTTRYDYLRDERHHDCFYTFAMDKEGSGHFPYSSVILYIAHRTGHFSPSPYHYEQEEQ